MLGLGSNFWLFNLMSYGFLEEKNMNKYVFYKLSSKLQKLCGHNRFFFFFFFPWVSRGQVAPLKCQISPGTPCNGPRVCHRLDFRVCGPLVVASSLECMRRLKRHFARQEVEKVDIFFWVGHHRNFKMTHIKQMSSITYHILSTRTKTTG